jgi:hypothetical protein
MPLLVRLVRFEGIILLGGFLAVVGWKLASGQIALSQLLEGDAFDPQSLDHMTTYPSLGRAQSLGVTLFVATSALLQILKNPAQFPVLPTGYVELLAGSQLLYLVGKANALLLGFPSNRQSP